MRKILRLLYVLGMLMLTSSALWAQNIDYLAKAKEFLNQGDCERAEYAYQDYKKSHPAGNGEVEQRIKECKQHYCPSTLSDFEGNNYRTVRIGNQCWMSENLRTVYDRNDKKLNENIVFSPGGDKSNVRQYGYLYNWNTAMKICPNGWHLPDSDEWRQLISGCETIGELAGGARGTWIESSGKTDYKKGYPGDYSYANRNKTGFNALPAGSYSWCDCEPPWNYQPIGYAACFWTANEDEEMSEGYDDFFSIAYYVYFPHEQKSNIGFMYSSIAMKHDYFSVRCVKD